MKKSLYIMTLLLTVLVSARAQEKTLSKEDFRSRQRSYFVEKAQLEKEEAKQFFDLYYELQAKKQDLNRNIWIKFKKAQTEDLSEEEYDMISEDIIRTRIQSSQLDMAYFKKYKKFLSSKKIYMIQKAEISFQREMLKRYKRGCQPQVKK